MLLYIIIMEKDKKLTEPTDDTTSNIIQNLLADPEAVANRLNQLLEGSSESRVLAGDKISYTEFIKPTIGVISESQLLSKPYYLDDFSVYQEIPEILAEISSKVESLNIPAETTRIFNIVFHTVQQAQFMYFNHSLGGSEAAEKRASLLADIIEFDAENDDVSDEDKPVSIQDLKEAALCMERAVVCHNLFKFFGIDSTLKTGRLESDDGFEYHAWVEFYREDGQRYLYDPTNPHIIISESGSVINIKPMLIKIDSQGGPVTTSWKTLREDGTVIREKQLQYF